MYCITKSISSMTRKVILLIYSVLVRPHIQYCIQFQAPHYKTDGLTRESHAQGHKDQKTIKMIKGLEYLSYKEKLKELGVFSLEKEAQRNLINTRKYLKRKCNDGSQIFFSGGQCQDKKMGTNRRFPLNTRNNFHVEQVVEKSHRLARETVEFPSWRSPKATGTHAWVTALTGPALEHRLE